MNVGTAKPSEDELQQVPHHFINSLSIDENYDVRMYEKDSLELLERLFDKHQVVIMTGGSGMFADAVTNGMDEIPAVDAVIRKQIIEEYTAHGLEHLQQEVAKNDAEYYSQVDQKNPQRLMRALEVIRGTGRPFSSFRIKNKVERPFQIIKVGLEREREELYARIDSRMDQMIGSGLFDEAKSLFNKRELNALQTVGYTEVFGFLNGDYTKEEAIRLLKRNSRRYAKRQLTWFRKDPTIRWFHPEQEGAVEDYIKDQMG